MRHFIATCCAAVIALGLNLAHNPALGQGASQPFKERSPPATEPSIQIPEKPPATTPKAETPKPPVPKKLVLRQGKGPTGPVTIPPPDVLVMMVRGALAGVNQANFTENYSVLHAMTTPALQARVTIAQFGRAFANLRKQNLDLSPALVLSPQFTATPAVTSQGILRLAGAFPSRPLQINFAIDYRPVDGFWLIDAVSVSAVQAGAPKLGAGTATSAFPVGSPEALAKPGMWDVDLNTLLFAPSLSFAANSH